MSYNVAFIGCSGVGKGKASNAIPNGKAGVVEPYRARKDGARGGEKVYVAPEVLLELLHLNRAVHGRPLIHRDSGKGDVPPYGRGDIRFRNWLEVYRGASFFMVRDTAQVLLHNQPDGRPVRKIEIFAPVLSAILRSDAKLAMPYFHESRTIFVHLNPLSVPMADVDPSGIADHEFAEEGWDWESIQARRNQIVKGDEKRDDIAVRMALLPDEAAAWQDLAALAGEEPDEFAFIDCTEWSFFECRILDGECPREGAVRRILECVEQQEPDLLGFFTQLFKSP